MLALELAVVFAITTELMKGTREGWRMVDGVGKEERSLQQYPSSSSLGPSPSFGREREGGERQRFDPVSGMGI